MLKLTDAVPEDSQGIAAVHVGSWQAAYADILDSDWLGALSVEKRATQWASILAARESRTLVARDEGGIKGFVSFGKCRDEGAPQDQGEIWALYASPKVWGQGYGRALLEYAMNELHAAGARSVSLWVLSRNERGIKFYEACGFIGVARSEKLFDLGGRTVEEVLYIRRQEA